MKKTAMAILVLAVSSFICKGQTAYDAWNFSENNYEGTARSIAMGNAFTALGGDLGAVTINPAGSAVAGYSQLTLTPSITISSTTVSGVMPKGSSSLPYFDKIDRTTMARAGIPNVGFVFNFDTGRKTGIKGLTFGFVLNQTNSWCENAFGRGTNYTTSFAGAAAYNATEDIAYFNDHLGAGEERYSYNDLHRDRGNDSYDYGLPWSDIVNYRSRIICEDFNNGERFVGATEVFDDNGNIMQGGPVDQSWGRSTYGNKHEYVFNFGMNISDFVYIGFNLGVNSMSYDLNEYFKERAVDENDFRNEFNNGSETITTYFKNLEYRYSYSATGSGVFGKFGIILTPGNGLRIGAAIQTPTSTTIKEKWTEYAECNYDDPNFSGSEKSPTGEYKYSFNSPFRANFGLAYTLGRFAVISADYEVADYKSMKYKIDRHNMTEVDIEHFEEVNDDIRQAYGAAHYFRLGAELKPFSSLAIRAGYNLNTSAQKKYYDTYYEEYVDKAPIYGHSLSVGLGYSSKGSFFADLACRYSFATKKYYMPYNDYQYNDLGEIVNYSPELLVSTDNWKLLLTLGWRF